MNTKSTDIEALNDLPKYLTPSKYNKNFVEVDCDLFVGHLKENEFELMIDFMSNEGKTRREIFWNKKQHMLCCLQRCPNSEAFNICHMMFEVECIHDNLISKMANDIGSSTYCYRNYGIKAYVFYLKWGLDMKAEPNTFQKLLDMICVDEIKIGSEWKGYHILENLFGTSNYKQICSEGGCPEDWQLLLRKIDGNGLKTAFEAYADGRIDCRDIKCRIELLRLKPEQLYVYFCREWGPDNTYPSYSAYFQPTLSKNMYHMKSEEDRIYDLGLEVDVKAFIAILERKFIKYENLDVDIHGLPVGPSYQRISGTLLPYLKSIGFDAALKRCYPRLYQSELKSCVEIK